MPENRLSPTLARTSSGRCRGGPSLHGQWSYSINLRGTAFLFGWSQFRLVAAGLYFLSRKSTTPGLESGCRYFLLLLPQLPRPLFRLARSAQRMARRGSPSLLWRSLSSFPSRRISVLAGSCPRCLFHLRSVTVNLYIVENSGMASASARSRSPFAVVRASTHHPAPSSRAHATSTTFIRGRPSAIVSLLRGTSRSGR